MHDSKSLVKKATRKAFSGSLQEGTNIFRNIHSFISSSKKKKDKTETYNQEVVKSGIHINTLRQGKTLESSSTRLQSQTDFETQLIYVNSSDSTSSCEGSSPCVSPVVGQTFCRSASSSRACPLFDRANNRVSHRSATSIAVDSYSSVTSIQTLADNKLPTAPCNSSSLTLGREDELLLAKSRGLRRQPSGFKKENVLYPAPRTKLRRIHSMYASKTEVSAGYRVADLEPQELANQEQSLIYDSNLQSSGISHYYSDSTDDNLPRIKADTLVNLLNGHFSHHFDKVYLVDCRFEYEFRGGHIQGAINISSQKHLEQEFIHKRTEHCKGVKPPLVIFHCEFSSYRCPIIASHLRSCDRVLNYDSYPKLYYPDILILEGGYKSFFERCSYLCFPRNYVEMNSQENVDKCESEMEKFRRDVKRVVTRANSFHVLNNNGKESISNPAPVANRFKSRSQTHFQTKRKIHNFESSDCTQNYSSPFHYEAPPKLSLSRCSIGSSSPSSSTASSRLLLEDELEGGFGSPDLDGVADGEATRLLKNCNDSDSLLTMDGVKRSLFHSILKEEDNDTTFEHPD